MFFVISGCHNTPAKKMAEEVKKIAEYFNNPSYSRPRDELSIDWSEDVPEVQSSPVPCVSPASEHVPSSHIPRVESSNSGSSVLNYGNNQLTIASS